jgi:hypothetical protein
LAKELDMFNSRHEAARRHGLAFARRPALGGLALLCLGFGGCDWTATNDRAASAGLLRGMQSPETPSAAPWGIVTQHYDNGRTGVNSNETTLTSANVRPGWFGHQRSRSVPDNPAASRIYAQPLYVRNVAVGGVAHNLIYIATEQNYVYAYDADDASASADPILKTSLGPPAFVPDLPGGYTDKAGQYHGPGSNLGSWQGITSTPAIDLATSTMYVVAEVEQPKGTFFFQLHALDLSTLADKVQPATFAADVPGTAVGTQNGRVHFNAGLALQRTGLVLDHG